MKKDNIIIFDTTLRDGEQTPGVSLNTHDKIQIAGQIDKLGVDVIEAGFAAASDGDFDAVKEISKRVNRSTVCSLARAVQSDIDKAGKALQYAKKGRIHTFIATSKIHMEHKLKMKEPEVIKRAQESVLMAKEWVSDIEFSFEDAGRTDIGFMIEMCDAVIESGAKTINLPDTVGILMPYEIGKIISCISEYVGDRAIISTHNHNDLGMATANSIEAIERGARQIECTINGIGERAGNTALEEIIMILETKNKLYGGFKTNVNPKEIYKTSQMVAALTGINPQPNKAIVGSNAFAHESGIHQDGMLKNKSTYQIIDPEDIGFYKNNTIVLGKHSGRAAIKDKICNFGYDMCEEEITDIFKEFKTLCDNKKEVFEEDLFSIVRDRINKKSPKKDKITLLETKVGDVILKLKVANEIVELSEKGNGTIDGIFQTIDKALGIQHNLIEYKVNSVSHKKDALAEVRVKVEVAGQNYTGRGLDIDTIKASVLAYIDAVNKIQD